MTDRPRNGTLPQQVGDPAALEAAREARHAVLAELLAVYADGELPPETMAQLDAHLVGCASCRRELAVQTSLGRSLASATVEPAPPALRDRIIAATASLPLPASRATFDSGAYAPPRRAARPTGFLALVAFLLLALGAGAAWSVYAWSASRLDRSDATRSVAVERLAAPAASVPLLGAVLADYRRVMAGDLPGRARDLAAVRAAVAFPVEPLNVPALRLVAAWTTEIMGEPTAVLAYRWDDRVIVQYIVPEHLFFRHPGVRSATAAHRVLAGADDAAGVVAFPVADAGSLLVGEGSPESLAGAIGR